jgi:predicted deacylase
LLVEMMSEGPHTVSLSAGIHGDEPAAPWALYDLVRSRLLDTRFSYRIWPCLNPEGFAAGTRASGAGIDLNRTFARGGTSPEARALIAANRDRRFVLHVDLHEDPVARGAYVYEPLPDGAPPRFAAPLVRAFDDAGLPVQDLSDPAFDLGSPPEARAVQTIERGSVVMGARAESAYFTGGWPVSIYFALRAAAAVVTVESPGTRPWDERIAVHRVAVTAAISRLE